MNAFFSLLAGLTDLLMRPFVNLPLIVPVTVMAAIATVLFLLVYRWTSNQEGLVRVKNKLAASFFEIRLWNDDIGAIFRAQRDLLWNNLKYIGLNLVPILWLTIPFALAMGQLQGYWGYEPFLPGESRVVRAEVLGEIASAGRPDLELELPEGITLTAPPVWSRKAHEMAWQVRAEAPGAYEIALRLGDQTTNKAVTVGKGALRRSPIRANGNWIDRILYPSEPALDEATGLKRITIDYNDAEVDMGFWSIHWLVPFLLLTIVFAFAIRERMGVTF